MDLKGKFNRFKAKNRAPLSLVGIGGGIPAVIVGCFTLPVDMGATMALGATSVFSGVRHGGAMYLPSDSESYYNFNGEEYPVNYSEWNTLRLIEGKVDRLTNKFNSSANAKERTRLNKKIQKMVDQQKDILKFKMPRGSTPLEELPQLKIDRNIHRKQPKAN